MKRYGMNEIIQGLWIGARLSVMEQLSISSFLANGHEYHLYVYDEVKNIPEGTIVKDGNHILPSSMIFQYKNHKSYSGFSNYFRYKLLLENGGWWSDTDTVCLKPFDFDSEYVFSTELSENGTVTNTGVIKCPAASRVMLYAWETCQRKDPESLVWGEVGPRLFARLVKELSLENHTKSYKAFCPFSFKDWEKVLDPNAVWDFDESTYAVHLWNEMWRRGGQDKDQRFHPDCLYERLKRKYLKQVPLHACEADGIKALQAQEA